MNIKVNELEEIIKLDETANGVFAIPSKDKMSDEETEKKIEELKKGRGGTRGQVCCPT